MYYVPGRVYQTEMIVNKGRQIERIPTECTYMFPSTLHPQNSQDYWKLFKRMRNLSQDSQLTISLTDSSDVFVIDKETRS